jgi:acyl carrier protein
VTEQASFADDLDADSLDLVELVMQLEDSLDVTIPEDDLGDVRTVGDALDLIVAASAAKA